MKGQMFLIITIVIVSGLLIIKATSLAPELFERKKISEATLETRIHDNIVKELKNVPRISANDKENITTNVFDFANFTQRKMNERFLDFKFFFVGSLARTSNIVNTSVLNLMGEQKNVTLNLNGTIKNSLVSSNSRWDTSFDITAGSTYTMTVSFTNYTENVTIKTKSNKDVYVGLFDVYLESQEAVHRNLTQQTYVLED
jgi:hypothetical protein